MSQGYKVEVTYDDDAEGYVLGAEVERVEGIVRVGTVLAATVFVPKDDTYETFLRWAQLIAEEPLSSETPGVAKDHEGDAIREAVRRMVQEVA